MSLERVVTCPCEMCSSSPAPTYTRAYLLACLDRELRGWLPEERREFLVKFAEGKSEAVKAEFRKALKEC